MQQRAPLVTVIIPTYKRPNALDGVLASVRAQTYPNIRVLISDDASPDNTFEVCQRLIQENQDMDIRYRRNPQNRREYRNVNSAFAECAGTKYVAVLQDDTRYVDPDWIQIAVNVMESEPEASYAAGHYHDSGGRLVNLWDKDIIVDGKVFWRNWIQVWCFWPTCLFRYERLAEIGFLDTSLYSQGDTLLLLKAALIGKVILINRLVLEDGYQKTSGTYDEYYKDIPALFQENEACAHSAAAFALLCGIPENLAYDWYLYRMGAEAANCLAKCKDGAILAKLLEVIERYDPRIPVAMQQWVNRK